MGFKSDRQRRKVMSLLPRQTGMPGRQPTTKVLSEPAIVNGKPHRVYVNTDKPIKGGRTIFPHTRVKGGTLEVTYKGRTHTAHREAWRIRDKDVEVYVF